MEIFIQIQDDPGFGSMKNTIRNRIIYDRYNYIKANASEGGFELYEYLKDAQQHIQGNDTFANWIKKEFDSLAPPPTPEPTPAPTEEPEPEPTSTPEENLVKSIVIGGVSIPVEFIALGAIVFLLLVLIIRRKNQKKRGYLFR